MLIPVSCFSCNKRVAEHWMEYARLTDGECSPNEALDRVGIARQCCRRMLLTSVELNTTFLQHELALETMDNVQIERTCTFARRVEC